VATHSIETSLMIAHPPQQVWDVLTDFGSFPAWNPFVIAVTGELRLGARLAIKVRDPRGTGGVIPFRPVVTALEPGRLLAWTGRLLVPGVFDGEHYYRLEPMEGGTRFVHGEHFGGVLLGLMGGAQAVAAMQPGYEAMNHALAEEVARRAGAA
jgi:hypothetical protein